MNGKLIAASMGLGVVAGAVAVMMLPRQNAARRLAKRTALEVEDAMAEAANRIGKMMG